MKEIIEKKVQTFTVKGYGASGDLIGGKKLQKINVERPYPSIDEILIEVLYCGVCHSDIHQVNNDWKNTRYPCVPGHEIIGKVIEVGSNVNKFSVGEHVGVGCMINSCKTCVPCQNGEEQFCMGENGMTMTYNGYFNNPESDFNTFGGFSTHIVSNKDYVIKIPANLNIVSAAPILCAGVTTYSPLKNWGIKAGDNVGIIGIGGLGHMGIMIAKAMGATVTAITTSENKKQDALELGADLVMVSENEEEMKAHELRYDFLLCTIPDQFDINPYVNLLAPRGSIVTVGLLGPYKTATNNMEVAKYARSVGASVIGSIKETQEVIDFCAEHNISPEVEMIDIENINEAFEKIIKEEVRFRYVIDMATFN